MTDHPDPATIRLEGQRLVEAATPRMTPDALIESAEALLELDEKNALVPHGIGGLARDIIQMFVLTVRQFHTRLAALTEERDALREQVRPGSPTERAPTTWAYEQACAAIEKHRTNTDAALDLAARNFAAAEKAEAGATSLREERDRLRASATLQIGDTVRVRYDREPRGGWREDWFDRDAGHGVQGYISAVRMDPETQRLDYAFSVNWPVTRGDITDGFEAEDFELVARSTLTARPTP